MGQDPGVSGGYDYTAMPAKPRPTPKLRRAITMAAIRRYARQIAEQFQPEKIILFGSFAYGEPDEVVGDY